MKSNFGFVVVACGLVLVPHCVSLYHGEKPHEHWHHEPTEPFTRSVIERAAVASAHSGAGQLLKVFDATCLK